MKKKVFSLLGIMLAAIVLTSAPAFAEGVSCSHQWEDTGACTATCTEAGYQPQTCSLCGSTRNKPVSAAGHSWVDNGECTATCTENGVQPQICSVCGSTRNEPVSATGHIWDDNGECTATCTEDGVRPQICFICGSTRNKPVSATGHIAEIIPGKAATCTESGLTEGRKCSVCGEILVAQENTAAMGHSFDAWRETKAATATAAGEKERICLTCGYRETAVIPVLGHTHAYSTGWESDSTDHWHECACGEKADISAHTMKWVVDKEAAATEKGSKHEECTVCGYKAAAVEIPATGQAPDKQETVNNEKSVSPQTGDNSLIVFWITLCVLSATGLAGIVSLSKAKGKYCK